MRTDVLFWLRRKLEPFQFKRGMLSYLRKKERDLINLLLNIVLLFHLVCLKISVKLNIISPETPVTGLFLLSQDEKMEPSLFQLNKITVSNARQLHQLSGLKLIYNTGTGLAVWGTQPV